MRRFPGVPGLLALLVAQTGCFPIVPHYVEGFPTRRNVEKAMESSPELPSLPAEEVLLLLGEPDAAPAGERKWSYRWIKVKGVMILPPSLVTRTHVLTLSFDGDGRIAALEQSEHAGLVLGSPPPPTGVVGAFGGMNAFFRGLSAFPIR